MQNKKIASFTGLRFIMIMCIVLSHFEFLFDVEPIGDFYKTYLWSAGFSVHFFFMLSGFGMMLGNISKVSLSETKCPSLSDCFKYGISHIRKIYPVYIATIIFGVVARFIFDFAADKINLSWLVHEFVKFVVNALLMQSATGMFHYTHAYNGAAWFLSCLFCIYLVSPMLIFVLRKVSKNYVTDIALIVLDMIMMHLMGILLGKIEGSLHDIKGIPDVNNLGYVSPFYRVFYVLIGMSVACIFCRMKENQIDLTEKKASILEIIVTVLFLHRFLLDRAFPLFSGYLGYVYEQMLPAIFLLIFAFDKGKISNLLHRKTIQILGGMAMYIFLIHYAIRFWVAKPIETIWGWTLASSLGFIVFILSVTFGISYWLWKKSVSR